LRSPRLTAIGKTSRPRRRWKRARQPDARAV
jgi:hypothetical protein